MKRLGDFSLYSFTSVILWMLYAGFDYIFAYSEPATSLVYEAFQIFTWHGAGLALLMVVGVGCLGASVITALIGIINLFFKEYNEKE